MGEHTPTPWTYRDVSGAGLEIRAPVYKMTGVDLPRGMPEEPIQIFQFTAPQMVQIAAERWVQFEPTGWSEMQEANAAFIVKACNAHNGLVGVVRQMVEAYDSGNLQMNSQEIGDPENGIPYHPWHEELLHHARAALAALEGK